MIIHFIGMKPRHNLLKKKKIEREWRLAPIDSAVFDLTSVPTAIERYPAGYNHSSYSVAAFYNLLRDTWIHL